MASAALGGILPGWDVSADADKSASRGFEGHAEGRHLIFRFAEEGIHDGSEPRRIVSGQLNEAISGPGQMSTNLKVPAEAVKHSQYLHLGPRHLAGERSGPAPHLSPTHEIRELVQRLSLDVWQPPAPVGGPPRHSPRPASVAGGPRRSIIHLIRISASRHRGGFTSRRRPFS